MTDDEGSAIDAPQKKSSSRFNFIHYTNGLSNFGSGGDAHTTGLKQIVESSKWKESNPVVPTMPLQYFYVQHLKKERLTYYDRAFQSCNIMAEQLGYDLPDYLEFRTWVTEHQKFRKGNPPRVSYRKLEDNLVDVNGSDGHSKYRDMMSALSKLEEGTQPEGACGKHYLNWKSGKGHPTHLGTFPTMTGFGAQLVDNAEFMHLCWVLTERIFSPILYKEKIGATEFKQRTFLMGEIFGQCKKKNALIEMLRDVVTVLGSPAQMILEHSWVHKLLLEDATLLMNRISVEHGLRFKHEDFASDVNEQFSNEYAKVPALQSTSPSSSDENLNDQQLVKQLDFFYGPGNGKNQIESWRHFIAIKKRIVDKYWQSNKNFRDYETRKQKA
eukprot:scaffold6248_cov87-Cylindrotheca_fusiformis.AAC.6